MEQVSENTVEIPLKKIVVPGPLLKNSSLLSSLELEEILRAYDQLQPITVVPIGENYKLVSGVHCYKAAKRLEMETVKAVIVKDPREKGGCKRLGDSVEKALLIARYAKLIGVSDSGAGRPGLLSTEQVEKVKEMHRQGKSLRKIAKEVGVSHETVRQYMMKESAPTSKSSVARLMSVREVAMRLGVSHAFISDCLSVEEAVRKHPSLRKLKKVAHVKKIVELADAFQATEERVKAAVNLIVEHKMTPEQIQRAKELRGQGISLRKIARELGVSHETVRQYLKVHEAAPETGIAKENTRQIMSELGHYLTPITRQTAEGQISEAGKAQPAEVKPYLSGLRGVASAFAISPDTVSRSLEVEKAIGRHPCLDRLSRVEDIQELDELAPKISASEEEIEGAVNLIVEHNIPARVALRMQRLPKEKWESFIEVCKKHPRPHYDIEDAVLLMLRYPEKNLTPERAFELASKMEERFVVYLRSGEAYEALEQAAKNSKIAPEQYIAIATVEKLCREGYISDATYLDAVSLARLDRPLCQVI